MIALVRLELNDIHFTMGKKEAYDYGKQNVLLPVSGNRRLYRLYNFRRLRQETGGRRYAGSM